MQRGWIRYLFISLAGLLFWGTANLVQGTREPWDGSGYPYFYLAALGLCAAFGYLFQDRPWRWGLIVIFAQLPVMMLHAGIGSLLMVGLLLMAIEALPAILAAMAGAHIRKLQRRSGTG